MFKKTKTKGEWWLIVITVIALLAMISLSIQGCAPNTVEADPVDIAATVEAALETIPPPPTPEPEIIEVVVTATPDLEGTMTAAAEIPTIAPTEPGDGDFTYQDCPLPIQYFEEMMWNGTPANQDVPKPNFAEYGGHVAWVKYGSDATSLHKDPMVLIQRCAWQVVGYLYHQPQKGFTATLSEDGQRTTTCTWWEVTGSHVATTACYLQLKNPLNQNGLWKFYGTIDRGSYRQPLCIGTEKGDLVASGACKFPGGNNDLGLLEYPYDLGIPLLQP